MRRLALIFTLPSLIAGCASCRGENGAQPQPGPGFDGSVEAGAPDASWPDAKPDTAPDSHPDAADSAQDRVDPPAGVPVWEPMPQKIAGCSVDRLANAGELKLFNWQPCLGVADCDEAVLNPDMIEPGAEMRYQTRVVDTGQETFVGAAFESTPATQNGVYIVREGGDVVTGFRTHFSKEEDCQIYGVAFWNARFGVEIGKQPTGGTARMGGLLGDVTSITSAVDFELSPLPPSMAPGNVAMGESRWLWRWYPDQIASFSNVDGSGLVVFAHLSDTILQLSRPTSVGPAFLFEVFELTDAGQPVEYIARSDGVSAPAAFLPATAGVWTGSPVYARSHIAWMRGIHPHGDLATFDSAEVWASEFHSVSEPLQPYKVDDFPVGVLGGEPVGGWGHFASFGMRDLPRAMETLVWNLTTKAKQVILLPDGREIFGYPGITRTHMWILARESSTLLARYLMRVRLQ